MVLDVTALFSLGELFADFNLVLKLITLMTIIAYIQGHLGKTPLAVAAILLVSWFVLFDAWQFFGGIFVLYTLLTMGVSGIMIDFFFISQGVAPQQAEVQAGGPVSSGADVQRRMKHPPRMPMRPG